MTAEHVRKVQVSANCLPAVEPIFLDGYPMAVAAGVARYLLEHGRAFAPSPRPKGYRQMKQKACFRNAGVLADKRGLTYCEGVARDAMTHGGWVAHAWCVDSNDRLIDPTWDPEGVAYFGVTIDAGKLTEVVLATGSWGSVLEELVS